MKHAAHEMFPMANGIVVNGPCNSEIFIKGRAQKTHILNLTGEGSENISHASIMICQENSSSGQVSKLPIGDSHYDIPHGAVVIVSCDSDNTKIIIGWE